MAKPSKLQELCQLADYQTPDTAPNDEVHPNSSFQSSSAVFVNESIDRDMIKPMRLTCSCRKRRVTRQKIAAIASWVFSSETSNVQDHLPACPFRKCVTGAKQTRWEVRFAGLRGLISCAVALSFSASFGAGGFSLSPNFTYYPSVNSSTTPVFRVMDLLHWFLVLMPCPLQMQISCPDQTEVDEWVQSILDFIDLCMDNISFLYEREKASPRAIDEFGRSILHHLSRTQVRHRREDESELENYLMASLILFEQKIFRYGQVPFVWYMLLRRHIDDRFVKLADLLIRCGVPSMTQDIYGM